MKHGAEVNAQDLKSPPRKFEDDFSGLSLKLQSLMPIKNDQPIVPLPPRKGSTPLHYAVANKHLQAVQLLLGNGASVHITDDSTGFTPLFLAVLENCHWDIIASLLEAGSLVNQLIGQDKESVLHVAASKGLEGLVFFLIDRASEMNIDGLNGNGQVEGLNGKFNKVLSLLFK